MLTKFKKIILLIIVIFLGLILIPNIDLGLPEGTLKTSKTNGIIKTCDIEIKEASRYTAGLIFIGIVMKDENIPYLRWNPKKQELTFIQKICRKKSKVQIVYTAKRTLLRPTVTYWIESIVEY